MLEELGLPFEDVLVTTSQVKEKAYTDINPNGRIPAIHDPNTDLTLWEVRIQLHHTLLDS